MTGLELLKAPEATAGEIADIISGIIIYLCAFSLLFRNLIVTLFTGKRKKIVEPEKPDAPAKNGKEADKQ